MLRRDIQKLNFLRRFGKRREGIMMTVKKARKILGSRYEGLTEETLFDILGFMKMLATIDYKINTK